MIDPDGLLDHAEKLANAERGRPTDVDLRRGISAAYYAVYHELTGQAASHLVGSCPQRIQNEIRRSWSHGEISQLAEHVVGRAEVLSHAPDAALPRRLERLGPLWLTACSRSTICRSYGMRLTTTTAGDSPGCIS